MDNSQSLILASGSPRRRELLSQICADFVVNVHDVDESCSLHPMDAVAEISMRKALACKKVNPGRIILAADTLVSLNGVAFGKPKDDSDAFHMLRQLSGHVHQVYTGVAVIKSDGTAMSDVVSTDVHFLPVNDEAIRRYVATGEPMDKAGAYAIQGGAAQWICEISGSYSNVIGLPLEKVSAMLKSAGITIMK